MSKTYTSAKRILDIFFSIILIIALLPLFFIITLLLKHSSPGPVIFRQDRLGKDGNIFEIYKFRSMKTNAPNLSSRHINNDDYVTTLGKFLRRSSLDELPQLYNILKGDMSFVGPRPFIVNEGEINDLRKKHKVDALRPGLTGWAQVVARDTCDQKQKFQLDLFYMDNFGFLLDLKIVLQTFLSLNGK